MKITFKDLLFLNQFRQNVVQWDEVGKWFHLQPKDEKASTLRALVFMVIQSHPTEADLAAATTLSRLKVTQTPCVMLRKSLEPHNIQRLEELPDQEYENCFRLLMYLWCIAEERQIDGSKWWHSNLGDEKNVEHLLMNHEGNEV